MDNCVRYSGHRLPYSSCSPRIRPTEAQLCGREEGCSILWYPEQKTGILGALVVVRDLVWQWWCAVVVVEGLFFILTNLILLGALDECQQSFVWESLLKSIAQSSRGG